MPAMIHESSPYPSSARTLPTSRSAPGATPRSAPPEALPLPPTVDRVCVPWPLRSRAVSPGTKLTAWLTRPARSGWSRSAPVSSTATLTPAPSTPAAHAAGAPICAVLCARSACSRASSQILLPPAVAVFGTSAVHACRTRLLAARTARPWMLGSVRTALTPAGTAGRAAAVGGEARISGTPSLCASS
jgi:hypothetical protein